MVQFKLSEVHSVYTDNGIPNESKKLLEEQGSGYAFRKKEIKSFWRTDYMENRQCKQ